ncbi:MAG TPA: hypothetical protein VGZ33_01305, partial [Acidimicrobiales bacterium]|nr:hypothetical protein [Acidimicrobiales bacterium]
RLTARLVAVLYVVIVASALIVGGAFRAVGLAPSHVASRAIAIGAGGIVTTVLNLAALATVGVLLAVRARRRRSEYASRLAASTSRIG